MRVATWNTNKGQFSLQIVWNGNRRIMPYLIVPGNIYKCLNWLGFCAIWGTSTN